MCLAPIWKNDSGKSMSKWTGTKYGANRYDKAVIPSKY